MAEMARQYYEEADVAEVMKYFEDDDELVKICNRQRLSLATSPTQSGFRVFAFLIITHKDREGELKYAVVEGANTEQGYIGGAICAERAALARLRLYTDPVILKLVVTTDSTGSAISPGILCREYMMSHASPICPVVMGDSSSDVVVKCKLEDLLPHAYVYRNCLRKEIAPFASKFITSLTFDEWNESDKTLYESAKSAVVHDVHGAIHPLCFAGAVLFSNGDIEVSWMLKGMEYGCTLCPVQQLLREMEKKKQPKYCCECAYKTAGLQAIGSAGLSSGTPPRPRSNSRQILPVQAIHPVSLVMVDQFGIAHAPFAQARALLTEHGFGDIKVLVHEEKTGRAAFCLASDLTPPPPGEGAGWLTHDEFV